MNVTSLTTDHATSGSFAEDSTGKGVLIMDACPVTALAITHVLKESCGITEPINYVPDLASIPPSVASAPPGLLIMDICGEKELILDGLRLLANLHDASLALKIVICTEFSDLRVLKMLQSFSVNGLLLKQEPVLALTKCITEVMSGEEQWLSPKAKMLLSKTMPTIPLLTVRELDVLACLFSGQSVSRVARKLHRNIRTVSTHKRNAMIKMGFHNDSELYSQGTWMVKVGPGDSQ